MSTIDELIANAKAELESPAETAVEILIGGEIVEFVFVAFDGREWSDLTAVHPPRQGSRDLNAGYNTDSLAEDAAPKCGFRVVDGERQPLSLEQWGDLFGYEIKDGKKTKKRGLFSGPDRTLIATVIWGLNVFEPQQRVLAAKKALRAAQPKKRS